MIKNILSAHFTKYPKAEISDAVKLIFQNEFGGGHLIKDEKTSLGRVKAELENTKPDLSVRLCEDIGNGKVRLNLAAAGNIPPELINRCFVRSAEETKGSVRRFEEKLRELQALCAEGKTPFPRNELDGYLSAYKNAGYPAVSHSESYKKAYSPTYRIIKKEYAELLPAATLIEKKLSENGKAVAAVGGRCASGKTTLAAKLGKLFLCPVIHADDFFLPLGKRTPERLAEPGGNIDYERFSEEVLPFLASGEAFSYGVFDCSEMRIKGSRFIPASAVRIVEGSYSMHPKFRSAYDVKIFMTISAKKQLERIKKRDGQEKLVIFREKWIPMEEKYFLAQRTSEAADIILE